MGTAFQARGTASAKALRWEGLGVNKEGMGGRVVGVEGGWGRAEGG